MRQHLAFIPAIVGVLCLGGCSGPMKLTGKAIRGEFSFIGVVDVADPRLEQEGLEGVELTVRGVDARSDRILADAHSKGDGAFKLSIEDHDALLYPALFHAHLDGYADARQPMPVPPSGRRVLVILKPIGPGAAK